MKRQADKGERGVAVLTMLVMLGLMSALVGIYSMNVRAAVQLRGALKREQLGFYTAEAGLNVGVTRFVNIFKSGGVPESLDAQQTLELGKRTAVVELNEVPGCNPCDPQPLPNGQLFGGMNSIKYKYRVRSRAYNNLNQKEADIGGEFDIDNVPIFQFLAFIDGNLFIMPAPNMSLSGRVHTNSDLYININSGRTLRIQDSAENPFVQVTAGKDIYRGGLKYSLNNWLCSGTVLIDGPDTNGDGDLDPIELPRSECPASGSNPTPVSEDVLNQWEGMVQARVQNIITPSVGIIEPDADEGTFWKRADLRVILNLNAVPAPIPFGVYCPGAPPSPPLYPIEVVDVTGARDQARTDALWRFMCERRGAIFYNEMPTAFVDPADPDDPSGHVDPNNATNAIGDASDYVPPFGLGALNPRTSAPFTDPADWRVYRRVGEDTNGDGVIDNNDSNCDICPPSNIPDPWWEPSFCDARCLSDSNEDHRSYLEDLGSVNINVSCADDTGRTNCPANQHSGLWWRDMDYRRGGFWNPREMQWMRLLNINLRALIEWNQNQPSGQQLFDVAQALASDDGLVFYFSVFGPHSNDAWNNYGVRIFDSADFDTQNITFDPNLDDPKGLTVVSDQAIVIEGNYNTHDWVPAAVVADAIYILSQSWEIPTRYINGMSSYRSDRKNNPRRNDRKSAARLSTSRRDVNTDDDPGYGDFWSWGKLGINAALLFGLGPNTVFGTPKPDYYNGGLENFLRFLESWRGRWMVYRGSFVSLDEPNHKKNDWACGSGNSPNANCPNGVYDPPYRDFNYDSRFNDVENLPPLTPRVVWVQQQLYTRFFD